jgi:sulfide:quinone oxidoreductase
VKEPDVNGPATTENRFMPVERPFHAQPKVLIAGGGVAGLETMLALRHHASERIDIELMAPAREFVYRPLATAEQFGLGSALRFDLARIAADASADYTPDAIVSVDPEQGTACTRSGKERSFDVLVIACGARMRVGLPGATTFWGARWSPWGDAAFSALLQEIDAGEVRDVVFVLPGGANWPLPIYELALLTASRAGPASELGLTIVTHESAPLAMFGARASERIGELLEAHRITVVTSTYAAELEDGYVQLVPAGRLAADRVVALPRLEGRPIPGIPQDKNGFIPVDPHGVARGIPDVYAAGDIVAFGIKQGGIAAQQADAVAEHIAARAGAPVEPRPFSPVLRGLLLTGREPRYLRNEATGGKGDTSAIATSALWWPPAKIAGRFLAPYLATGVNDSLEPPVHDRDAVPVEVQLS